MVDLFYYMAFIGESFTYFNQFYYWLNENVVNVITTAVVIGIVLIAYRILTGEIEKLKNREVIDHNTTFLFKRISKWTVYIVFVVLIFNTLGIKIDFFLGLWVLAGGTIIGFASMNTIGNALAGLIIMVSRPFKINDQLFFQEQNVQVEDIDLIYTRMRTLDNEVISVPNQIVLNTVISNQSVYKEIRRKIVLTADYNQKPEHIRDILLSSIKKVEEIVNEPEPYVWITDFKNFAMEYTLFYYITEIKNIQIVDSKVREAIINEFTENGIDMSTPNLIKSLK